MTEKIKLCYDRELDEARMQLKEIRLKFNEFAKAVYEKVKSNVREETNKIDAVMK